MNVILLSGGSGKRLWPLSNGVRSKQFLKIFKTEAGQRESMLQRVFRLISAVDEGAHITIATSQNQIPSIVRQLGRAVDVSVEPSRKDTFPAIALSAAYLHDIKGISEEESVVVCPVDPFVEIGYFRAIKKMDSLVGRANLVLMGIKPTYPSEKYGYILQKHDGVTVKEKPDESTARKLIKQGALWNGGVFAFQIKYVLEKAKEIIGYSNYNQLLKNYDSLKAISFDYAVVEHETDIDVVKYEGEWKDLGTWNTLTEAMSDSVSGDALLDDNCRNVHVVNELSLPIIGLGLDDLIIAATPDGILVADKTASAKLKDYVPDRPPMYDKKIWGEIKVLDRHLALSGGQSLVAELRVFPKENTRYQKHFQRSESWTVVSGVGRLVLNGKEKTIKAGDAVMINPGVLHSVRALEELTIIVVQIGNDLSQEDIEFSNWDWSEANN